MVGTEVKISKICLSELAEVVFLEPFLYIYALHLCFLFCYQVSCFRACLRYLQSSPRYQGTENLVL